MDTIIRTQSQHIIGIFSILLGSYLGLDTLPPSQCPLHCIKAHAGTVLTTTEFSRGKACKYSMVAYQLTSTANYSSHKKGNVTVIQF